MMEKDRSFTDGSSRASEMSSHPELGSVSIAPSDAANSPNPVDSYVGAVKKTWDDETAIGRALAPNIRTALQRKRKAASVAKRAFRNLSAVPPAKRLHPLFVPSNTAAEKAAEIHVAAIEAGLKRIREQYKGQLRLRLSEHDIEELGLKTENGQLVGQECPASKLADLLGKRQIGTDLLRAHSLSDFFASPLGRSQVPAETPEAATPAADPTAGGKGSDTPKGASDKVTAEQAREMILNRVAGQLQGLETASTEQVEKRPDVAAVSESVGALELTGGPSDVTAFHDVRVLQVAFPDVWTEIFDDKVKGLGEALYNQAVQHYAALDQTVPPLDSVEDIATLMDFITQLQTETGIQPAQGQATPIQGAHAASPAGSSGSVHAAAPADSSGDWAGIPIVVIEEFPDLVTGMIWRILSTAQQLIVHEQAQKVWDAQSRRSPDAAKVQAQARSIVSYIAGHPAGPGGRLAQLMYELGRRLTEKYSFDIFAPDSYNYGILLTYRQKWEPLTYQAGDLVATVPLAPGETRKYAKKIYKKQTRAESEIARATSARSDQFSQTERAEAEIMRKTALATNFSMTTQGSFKFEMANISASNSFALNQSQDSASTKKDFHEATIRAAQEYRRENSLQVDTTSAVETEETSSGEISNPNNEITVTYLFYELQRRYRVSEQIHRAQAVILVAQDVPAPHEIDEAWLVANQWILGRFLLDESLRPALDYLTQGFAGDEVSLEVLRAHWQAQRDLVDKLQQSVSAQLATRDVLREALVTTVLGKNQAEVMGPDTAQQVAAAIASGGVSLLFPGGAGNPSADQYEAQRKAFETRLQYVEDALEDAQRRLQSAADAFEKATQDYAAALEKTYTHRVAIDQLRTHVKQNILYYMHAIWDCESPDQRFFRLYNKKVYLFDADPTQAVYVIPAGSGSTPSYGSYAGSPVTGGASITYPPPTVSGSGTSGQSKVDLVEIADLDKPLGYKGNYIIFPLKKPSYITTFMLQEFVDDYFGIRDPDELGNWPIHEVARCVKGVASAKQAKADLGRGDDNLRDRYLAMLTDPRSTTDEIIVPTGQLFIEALPGRHPLLEDFKLRHRMEDVRKAQAEVRHAEMENLRLAARLAAGELEDPEIESRILVDRGVGVSVNPDKR